MHDLQSLAGTVAGLLALGSYVPYIASILRGKTKPSRATFGIWSFIGVVEVASYIAAGARTTIWLPIVYTLGAVVVFVLSIKRGMGGTQKLDIACLLGAGLGIVGWVVTGNPQAALYLSIFASACGFLPTIKKAYLRPETESALSWGIGAAAALVNVLAISSFALHVSLYPIYTLIFDTLVAVLAVFPRMRPAKRQALAADMVIK